MYPHQSERLTEALERGGLDALVATSPANVAYVTGFRSVRGAISHTRRFGVFTRGGTALVVPAVDGATVVADAVDADHVICCGGMCATFAEPSTAEVRRARAILAGAAASPEDALAEALTRLGVRQGSIGIDERGLGHGAWLGLSERLTGLEILVAAGHLAEARRVKAPYEVECLDRALRIAEEAVDAVVQTIDRGMTEREAATLYTGLVVKRGASPCPAIIAIGERTWIPAPWPTDRVLRTGDLVRFDVGCVYKPSGGQRT
jgi:Xaa-Pro aminopeptidase